MVGPRLRLSIRPGFRTPGWIPGPAAGTSSLELDTPGVSQPHGRETLT